MAKKPAFPETVYIVQDENTDGTYSLNASSKVMELAELGVERLMAVYELRETKRITGIVEMKDTEKR